MFDIYCKRYIKLIVSGNCGKCMDNLKVSFKILKDFIKIWFD